VDELREALRLVIREPQNRDEREFRKRSLEKCIKALTRIDDLRRAMLLSEWRDNEVEESVAQIDRPIREELGQKLLNSLREVLEKGNAVRKQAAATLIGESGASVRGVGSTTLMSVLAPDLVKLLDHEDKGVRAAAARALGKILPDPQTAVTALAKVLVHKDAGTRQAAADGLDGMMRTVRGLPHRDAFAQNRGVRHMEISREEVVAAAASVVPVAGRGLADNSAEVRRRCSEALQHAADLGSEVIYAPPEGLPFGPPGRKPSREEAMDIEQYRKVVEEERALVLPLAQALTAQLSALNATLADKDADVCVAAGLALESIAHVRQRLLQKAASVPGADKPEDPLAKGMQATVPAAAKVLAHKDVRARLAAIYVLETLGAEAAPAADALTQALADDDAFVRWGAARATHWIAPKAAAMTVPALAKLLNDDNHDVRTAAVAALQNYGPAAKSAVPALAKAVAHKDATMRVPALQALAAIKTEAVGAAPAVVKALSEPEAVVRQAAAQTLGKIGAVDGDAGDALRKALSDPDATVRQFASAALLGSS
jgi:HEAT repeat protein